MAADQSCDMMRCCCLCELLDDHPTLLPHQPCANEFIFIFVIYPLTIKQQQQGRKIRAFEIFFALQCKKQNKKHIFNFRFRLNKSFLALVFVPSWNCFKHLYLKPTSLTKTLIINYILWSKETCLAEWKSK